MVVAGAALITGVVGARASAVRDENLDRRKKAQKQAEIAREHRAFLESQIVKLWDLHDRLKTAAVLIAAYRTAKTYGEQMRGIIEIRTQLSDVSDTVKRRLDPLVTLEEFEVFRTHVERATKFLHPLVDEFRSNYLTKVSYKQRLDEATNKKLDEEGVEESQRRSTLAWDALKVESDFPGLQKLIHFGELSAEELEDEQLWKEAELTEGYLASTFLVAGL